MSRRNRRLLVWVFEYALVALALLAAMQSSA
jgi:hypothetical protein